MSNSLFGNPKIALGFAGGVVAVALIASVALNEFTPGNGEATEPAVAEAAAPVASPSASPAPQGFGGGGWADGGGSGGNWGAQPSASDPKAGFAAGTSTDPYADLPEIEDYQPRAAPQRAPDRSAAGPTITSNAAPGAPEVVPPSGPSSANVKVGG